MVETAFWAIDSVCLSTSLHSVFSRRIPNDVRDDGLSAISGLLIGHVNIHARGDEKSLAHRAAVDMHFLIVVPIRLDVEHHRRESGRYRSRRDQNMTNEIESAGVAACGDGSDIPQNRSPCVEIGRLDEEKAPFLVF